MRARVRAGVAGLAGCWPGGELGYSPTGGFFLCLLGFCLLAFLFFPFFCYLFSFSVLP